MPRRDIHPLEQITLVTSVAYRRAQERAPFDVINLDLCGSVAQQPSMTERGAMQAIKNILDLQQKRAEPWLFFLTTRVDSEVIDLGVQAELIGVSSQIPRVALPSPRACRRSSACRRQKSRTTSRPESICRTTSELVRSVSDSESGSSRTWALVGMCTFSTVWLSGWPRTNEYVLSCLPIFLCS